MQFKPPKDNEKYRWTDHVKDKMLYYGISESLIKRIVRFPKRKQEGVAPNTIAVMQPTSNKKQEVWVMLQEMQKSKTRALKALSARPSTFRESALVKMQNDPEGVALQPYGAGNLKLKNYQKPETSYQQPKCRIISAWRYPGISPVGRKIPIPDEILQELENLIE